MNAGHTPQERIARLVIAERIAPARRPLRRHPHAALALRRLAERLDPQARPVAERTRARPSARLAPGH